MVDTSNSSPMKAFQRPRSLQSGSTLMGIAQELRTKILRYVLKADEPLCSKKESEAALGVAKVSNRSLETWLENEYGYGYAPAPPAPRFGICLSAQVLATCQRLRDEGLEILHGENMLSIYVDNHYHYILDAQIGPNSHTSFPQNWQGQGKLKKSLLESNLFGKSSSNIGSAYSMYRAAATSIPSPQEFRHFRLVINRPHRSDFDHHVFLACQVLAPLLKSKRVAIRFTDGGEVVEPSDHLLAACRFLRTDSVTFDHTNAITTKQVTKMITGADESADVLLESFNDMMKFLLRSNDSCVNLAKRNAHCSDLLDSVLRADLNGFETSKKYLADLRVNDASEACARLLESVDYAHSVRTEPIEKMYGKQMEMLARQKKSPNYSKRVSLVKAGRTRRLDEFQPQYLESIQEYEKDRTRIMQEARMVPPTRKA